MLEGGALSTPEFKAFSETVVPFVHVTTRLDDREHEDLLFDKGGNSFPTLLVLDAEGEVLARIQPPYSVPGFERMIARVRKYLDLAVATKPDDKPAQIDLLILRCDLGQIDFGQLEEALEPLGDLSDAQQAAVKGLETNAAVEEMRAYLQQSRWSDESKEAAGEEFFSFYEEGAHPSAPMSKQLYWTILAGHAVDNANTELLERCIDELKQALQGMPGAEDAIKMWQSKLTGLGDKKGND